MKAAIDLNRALPPLPEFPEENKSCLALHTGGSSLNHSDTAHSSVSSTLYSSANHSIASSKSDFRNITRDLLLTVPTPEPQYAIINTLEPEKYNPGNPENDRETMGKL